MDEELRAELDERLIYRKKNALDGRPVLQIALGVYAGVMMAAVTLWLLSLLMLGAIFSGLSMKTDFPEFTKFTPPKIERRSQHGYEQRHEQQPLSQCIKPFGKIDDDVHRCMNGEILRTW